MCVIPHRLNWSVIMSSSLLNQAVGRIKAWFNWQAVITMDKRGVEMKEERKYRQRDCSFFLLTSQFSNWPWARPVSHQKHGHANKLKNEILISCELLTRVTACGGSRKEEASERDEEDGGTSERKGNGVSATPLKKKKRKVWNSSLYRKNRLI